MTEVQSLKSLYLFTSVLERDLQELCILAPPVHFNAGACIFEQGEPADVALFVIRGRLVALVRSGAAEKQVGDIRPGEVVGEQALLIPSGFRNAGVIAAEESSCLLISPDLLKVAAQNPAFVAIEQHLIGTMARRIRRTNQLIQQAWKDETVKEETSKSEPGGLRDRLRSLFGGGG